MQLQLEVQVLDGRRDAALLVACGNDDRQKPQWRPLETRRTSHKSDRTMKGSPPRAPQSPQGSRRCSARGDHAHSVIARRGRAPARTSRSRELVLPHVAGSEVVGAPRAQFLQRHRRAGAAADIEDTSMFAARRLHLTLEEARPGREDAGNRAPGVRFPETDVGERGVRSPRAWIQ